MVMWYGPNDRNFPGLDRIFPEGKIRRIRGKNPVLSRPLLRRAHDLRTLALTLRWAGSAPLLRRGWTLLRAGPYYAGPPRSRLVCPTWARARRPTLGARGSSDPLGHETVSETGRFCAGHMISVCWPLLCAGPGPRLFAPGLDPSAGRPLLRGAATLNGSSDPHGHELVCPTPGHEARLTRLGTKPCQRPAAVVPGAFRKRC